MTNPFMLKLSLAFIVTISPLFGDKWLAIGGGCCGIVRPKDRTAMIQIEYQPNPLLKPVSWFNLRPQAGFFINMKPASYVYGGFRFEFIPNQHLLITPGFAPGIYIEGQGKRLHFPLEFKSSFEIAYQYKEGRKRISAQFYHISNASIGRKNPGTEMLVFSYSFKL